MLERVKKKTTFELVDLMLKSGVTDLTAESFLKEVVDRREATEHVAARAIKQFRVAKSIEADSDLRFAAVQAEGSPLVGEGNFVGEVHERPEARGVFVARAYGPDWSKGVYYECNDFDEAVRWVQQRAKDQSISRVT